MRHKFIFPLVGLILLAALFRPIGTAFAADIRTGDRIVIAADETIDDDLIVSGDIIEVNGTITGDLIAAGRQIVVRGTVGGSAALAAQVIEIPGQIDGSLYATGYTMQLSDGAVVGRNLFFTGFNLTTAAGSHVERDVYMAGQQMNHGGSIGGDLNVAANGVDVNGAVGGDVVGQTAPAGTSSRIPFSLPGMPAVEMQLPGLRVGPAAQISGQVLAQEVGPKTQTNGQVPAQDVEPAAPATTGWLGLPLWLLHRIGETIGLLLAAIAIIAVAPRFIPTVSDALRRRPLPSLGWGALIYLIVFPVGLVVGLMLVVLLGILVGWLTFGRYTLAVVGLSGSLWLTALFAFLFFVYIVSWLIVGHLLGRGLLSRLGLAAPSRSMQFLYVTVGVILFEVLRAVPILGFILALLVGTFALGALFVAWQERRMAGTDKGAPLPAQ